MDYYIPPLPSVYWIDTIRECNLRCVMCPQSKGLKPLRSKMPVEAFRAVVDDVCGNRPLIKLYLSGEPLLHEGLFEMIEYAGSRGCRTMIHTNAAALTHEMAERILSSSLTFLSFSFDGCSAEVYEQLRPPAKFEPIQANIKRYLALRRRNGGGPRTAVEVIRMGKTDDLIQDFVEQWKGSGVDEVHVAEYTTWHGLVSDRSVRKEAGPPGYKPCTAPFAHGCILADGTVVPCCFDVNGLVPLGNIGTDRFRNIWTGRQYRRLRLQMLTGTLDPGSICDGCDNILRDG